MAWSADVARPLAEAFNGAPGVPGPVIAVATVKQKPGREMTAS
jgi:hypothetical protein